MLIYTYIYDSIDSYTPYTDSYTYVDECIQRLPMVPHVITENGDQHTEMDNYNFLISALWSNIEG